MLCAKKLNFIAKNICKFKIFIYFCNEEPFHHTCYMLYRLVRDASVGNVFLLKISSCECRNQHLFVISQPVRKVTNNTNYARSHYNSFAYNIKCFYDICLVWSPQVARNKNCK